MGQVRAGHPKLKCIQINIGRSRLAQDNLEIFAREEEASILLISEPNIKKSKEKCYLLDEKGDAAIAITGRDIGVQKVVKGKGFVAIWTDEAVMVSVYISPNVGQLEAEEVLDSISQVIREERRLHIIIAGDLNAKAKEWGNATENRRGRSLLEWMGVEDLYLLNDGRTPTFVRGEQASFIDLTLCKQATMNLITEWRVRDEELSCSLHRYITFQVACTPTTDSTRPPANFRSDNREFQRGWKLESDRHKENFKRAFSQECELGEISNAELLEDALTNACNSALPRKKTNSDNHKPAYWWTEQIETIRRRCIKKMRKATKMNRRMMIPQEEKVVARKEYREAK